MLTLIDNYDSFAYNLVHYFGELGAKTIVYRNDDMSAEEILETKPDSIVLSPGPCEPDKAGICLELIKKSEGNIPMLGVCLGHQSIAQAFGASIVRAEKPVHGKSSKISHIGKDLFLGIPKNFKAIRYHSLIVNPKTTPSCLKVTARTEDELVMGLAHNKWPIYGVQFHPESIETEYGHKLLNNFLKLSRKWRTRHD
jgi:anthranilate synthase component 2|tara:strand:- start:119 stop:709 length:591 start_codon:yes stop_codon:yes gene_type:complete